MCRCSPRVLTHRFCGLPVRLPDGKTGRCAHPAFGTNEPMPSTVNPTTGAWFEAHAREHDPPRPTGIHPGIAVAHLGFDLSQLDELAAKLKAAAAGDRTPIHIPFSLDVLANTARIAHVPGATAINGARRDSARHYPTVSVKAADAHRALEHVVDSVAGTCTPEKLRQLAHLVEHVAGPLCREVLAGLMAPPADHAGMQPHVSPVTKGEPV
jgi:hypothetical protein